MLFRKSLDAPTTLVRHVTKTQLKARLEALQRQLFSLRAKRQAAELEGRLVDILQAARKLHDEGQSCAVLRIEVGTDNKVLKRVAEEIRKVSASMVL